MALQPVVIFAASLWLMGAVPSSHPAAQGIDPEKAFGIRTIAIPTSVQGENVTSATLSGSGLLALGTASGGVYMMDRSLRAWSSRWERSAGRSAISSLAFSGDGAALAGTTDRELLVWRLDDQPITRIPIKGAPTAIALSEDGRRLAVADLDVLVFDVTARRLIRKFEQPVGTGGNSQYDALAFTPGSGVIAAASVDNTDAWNIESGKALQHWSCKCQVDGVALSRDAALAALAKSNAHVVLWDVAAAKLLRDKKVSAITGDHAYGTAVSLTGALVAIGTASGLVVVWDTRTNTIVGRTQVSGQPIVRIVSSDDGKILLIEGTKAEYVRGSYDRWFATLIGR